LPALATGGDLLGVHARTSSTWDGTVTQNTRTSYYFPVLTVFDGAIYLIYLGVRLIRKRGDDSAAVVVGGNSGRRAYLNGLLTNLLNPKMVTFTIAFLPQFIDPGLGRIWLQFTILGAIMIAQEFLVDGTVGVLAGRIGSWLQRRRSVRRRIDVATGGLFIGLGVRLAAER